MQVAAPSAALRSWCFIDVQGTKKIDGANLEVGPIVRE